MFPPTVNGLDNSIALRYAEGISYGAVDWIRGSRLKIQASARLKPGQVLDFRMELTGRPEAPYGLMQVTEVLPSTDGGAPHIIGTLLRMDTEDLAWLNQWLTEKRPGGQLAQMDASAESRHALQTPAASEALQQYIDHRGRLEPQANILRAPFAVTNQETSRPAETEASLPSSGGSHQASGYLKSMNKRRRARKNTPTGPISASTPPAPAKNEEWELPPPPPSALKRPSEPPQQQHSGFDGITCTLEEENLTVTWRDRQVFLSTYDDLSKGILFIPPTSESITGLTLILPDNTRLALRIKKMEQEENATKLSFRMNLILNGKLKASIE